MSRPRTARLIATAAVALAALAAARPTLAQRCPEGVRPWRAAVLAGGFAAAEVAVLAIRADDWWTTPRRSFYFTSGGSPSKGQDLLLHGAIAYQVSQLGALAWDWTCVSPTAAAWLGAALGIAVGLPKEIGDGLHEDKGFSVDDVGASVAAAILPALHRTVPATRVASLKVFYWPSAEYRDRAGNLPQLENDYAGQRYYLAFHPGAVPGGAGPWPDWLGVALGHGVPSWASTPPAHDWYATLDLRLAGLPIRAPWWKHVASVLDQVHIPLPGIRIRDGELKVGIY